MCEKYLEYETKLIHLQLMRITPADAGKTKPTDGHILRKQDHPRRCGENVNRFLALLANIGSPPQVRGKPLCSRPPTAGNRITPADAGKTHRSR